MKALDLNACGVDEMSVAQMRDVNGGSWLRTVYEAIKSGLIYDAICEYCEVVVEQYGKHGDDFQANAMRGH